MNASLYQLVSKNIEDSIFIKDPEISFFKNTYKRHTNFSRGEYTIRFKNEVDFENTLVATIPHNGDLLRNITLVLVLPEIEFTPPQLTYEIVKKLLARYGITYTIPIDQLPLNIISSKDDFIDINKLIYQKYTDITANLVLSEQIKELLVNDFQPSMVTHQDYKRFVLNSILTTLDITNAIYLNYVFARIDDYFSSPEILANAQLIQQAFYYRLRGYNSAGIIFLPISTGNHLIDNFVLVSQFQFYPNTYFSLYSNVIFNNILATTYEYEEIVILGTQQYTNFNYTELDAYKLQQEFFQISGNNILVTNSFDYQVIQQNLIQFILANYNNNLILFNNLFTTLFNISTLFANKTDRLIGSNFTSTVTQFLISFENKTIFANSLFFANLYSGINSKYLTNVSFSNTKTCSFDKYAVHITQNIYNLNLLIVSDLNSAYVFSNDLFIPLISLVKASLFTTTTIINASLLQFAYILNYFPLIIIQDIYDLLYDYLLNKYQESTPLAPVNPIVGQFRTIFTLFAEALVTTVTPVLNVSDGEFQTCIDIINGNTTVTPPVDKFLMYLIRPENLINGQLSMDFIMNSYLDQLAIFITNNSLNADPANQTMQNIILSFFTTHVGLATYQSQNNRVYQITDITETGFGLFTGNVKADSVGYYIKSFAQTVYDNYNKMWSLFILDDFYYQNSVGMDFRTTLNTIINYATPNAGIIPTSAYYTDVDNNQLVNWYELNIQNVFDGTSTTIDSINNLFGIKINEFNTTFANYNNYQYGLMSKLVSLSSVYFSPTDIIMTQLTTLLNIQLQLLITSQNIIVTPVLGDIIIPNVSATFNSVRTPMDIINDILGDFYNSMTAVTNPYTAGTHLYQWYIDYSLDTVNIATKLHYNDIFNSFIVIYDNDYLTKRLSTIIQDYNNFDSETCVYQFIFDDLFLKTNISFLTNNIKSDFTNEQVYIQLLTNVNLIIAKDTLIQTDTYYDYASIDINTDLLGSILFNKIYNPNTYLEFAWNNNIGAKLIDKVELRIDDLLIDSYTGEWLYLYHQLYQNNLNKNFDKMMGNVKVLTNYTKTKKPKYSIFIPLLFCTKDIALPIVAIHNSRITVSVTLHSLCDVAKWNTQGVFRIQPKLNGYLIGEYIYVENKERDEITTFRHELLIEYTQTIKKIYRYSDLIYDVDAGGVTMQLTLPFRNCCKELIFTLRQPQNSLYYKYVIGNHAHNMVQQIKFKLFGNDMEMYKDSEYYNYCIPYDRYSGMPDDGIYVYPFSLHPLLKQQPSGSLNLSKADRLTVFISLNPIVVEDLKNNDAEILLTCYGVTYNILRVISSLAGLAFL